MEIKLAEPLEITAVDIQGKTYYRIQSAADENVDRIRSRLNKIKENVARDAWLLISSTNSIGYSVASDGPENYSGDSDIGNLDPEVRASDSNREESESGSTFKSAPTNSIANGPTTSSSSDSSRVAKPNVRSFASLRGYGKKVRPKNSGNTTVKTTLQNQPPPLTRIVEGEDSTPLILPKYDRVSIDVDGHLDESVWTEVHGYDNMRVVETDYLGEPSYKTETKFFYTDQGLYVGTWAEQPSDKLIPRLTSRDQEINRDGTYLYLDTSGKGLYGMFFGINLGGTLVDGTMLPERQMNSQWDGPWNGSAATTEDGYSTEMFLPWSMMSMPETDDKRRMGLYVYRKVAYLDERWAWPARPSSDPRFLSVLQPIQLEEIHPRQQLAFYPFSASTYNHIEGETDYRTGMDLFWRPSSNLQLTATLNPDFGVVESDDVVVNLTAFETFFPEKRLFFLEGNEIFITSPRAAVRAVRNGSGARSTPNSFSVQPTTLVNTRRIGGTAPQPDIPAGLTITDVELGKPSDLAGAAKITGQQGPFRYGLMGAFEEEVDFLGSLADGTPVRITQDGRDFGVLRFLYESTGKGRRSIGSISTVVAHSTRDAITHGIDAHYLSPKGNLYWDGQLLYSDVEDVKGYGSYVDLTYTPSGGVYHRVSFDYLDDKLDVSDLGYIRRNDEFILRYTYILSTAQLERFRRRSTYLTFSEHQNTDGKVVHRSVFFTNNLTLHNSNQLTTAVLFKPKRWEDRDSLGNGDYRVEQGWLIEASYGTDSSRKISTSMAARIMSEEIGGWAYTGLGGITFKPNDRFSLDLDVSYRKSDAWLVHLDGPFLATYETDHWQPGLAMDVFLTATQQLRFTLQWVGIQAKAKQLYQVPSGGGTLNPIGNGVSDSTYDFTISRLTTQLRYRWEIAPLSDLFLVYTRGSNLPNRLDDGFGDLFHDAVTDPIVDRFVIKLRYRFGR